MNFIVAMLLMNVNEEEDVFWCFVSIMFPKKSLKGISGRHNWRQIFTSVMPKVIFIEKKIRKKLSKKAPSALAKILAETDGETLHAAFS